jgi:hypothetical protein
VIAPYVDGLEFVHYVRRKAGWQGVDAVWARPPSSTEQLLHPEKWFAAEKPETIPVPSASAAGPAKLIYHDIMGEQSVRLLFEEWMPSRSAKKDAAGWAGDRVAVFSDGKRHGAAWRVRFDLEDDARRGLVGFARGILRTEPASGAPQSAREEPPVSRDTAEVAAKSGSVCKERTERGPFAAVRRGRDLGIVVGPYLRHGQRPAQANGSCATALQWAEQVATQN